jgi:hypothetical protein
MAESADVIGVVQYALPVMPVLLTFVQFDLLGSMWRLLGQLRRIPLSHAGWAFRGRFGLSWR